MLIIPAGIGDHSTGDLHENLNEALSKLADADDRLDILKVELQCLNKTVLVYIVNGFHTQIQIGG